MKYSRKEKPLISIIMGIYNCAETLEEAIESIINQTYTNWQLIMCDDGSKDQTMSIAKNYQKKYPKDIILIQNEENMGLNYTLNRCLQYATGEYIARMDGDDVSLPQRLETEITFLQKYPEYSIVSSSMILFDEMGDWGIETKVEIPKIKDFVFHPPVHCHAPCMIRREAYTKVGGYTIDDRLLRYEDCNLWYKLYATGFCGYNIQEPLYKMRDDRNAYYRRTPVSRMRAVYVQYSGFRMIKMPIKYYPYLIVEFLKNVAIILLPEKIYMYLHRKKQKMI